MRKFVPALALSLGMAFAGSATAAPYVGLMWSKFTYSDNSGIPDPKPEGPTLRLGATISEWVGLEVRAGVTDSHDTWGVNVKAQEHATGLVRIGFPRSDKRLIPYLLGGWTYVNLRTDPSSVYSIEEIQGPTYGVGIDLFADAHHGLTLEWWRVDDDEKLDVTVAGTTFEVDYKVEHIGLGYTYRF